MFGAKFVFISALAGFFFVPFEVSLASPQEASHAVDRAGYAGDASCVSCHRQLSQSYLHTAHHLTSQLPTASSILGSFRNGSNTLTIVDTTQSAQPGLAVCYGVKGKTASLRLRRLGGAPNFPEGRNPSILSPGPEQRGQTYLYWQRDRLFELPVSYWSDGHRWINSPGYIDGTADFSRPVNPACLECHATYIRALSTNPATNRYDRGSLVPGISCESCHGPGANHVRQETRA